MKDRSIVVWRAQIAKSIGVYDYIMDLIKARRRSDQDKYTLSLFEDSDLGASASQTRPSSPPLKPSATPEAKQEVKPADVVTPPKSGPSAAEASGQSAEQPPRSAPDGAPNTRILADGSKVTKLPNGHVLFNPYRNLIVSDHEDHDVDGVVPKFRVGSFVAVNRHTYTLPAGVVQAIHVIPDHDTGNHSIHYHVINPEGDQFMYGQHELISHDPKSRESKEALTSYPSDYEHGYNSDLGHNITYHPMHTYLPRYGSPIHTYAFDDRSGGALEKKNSRVVRLEDGTYDVVRGYNNPKELYNQYHDAESRANEPFIVRHDIWHVPGPASMPLSHALQQYNKYRHLHHHIPQILAHKHRDLQERIDGLEKFFAHHPEYKQQYESAHDNVIKHMGEDKKQIADVLARNEFKDPEFKKNVHGLFVSQGVASDVVHEIDSPLESIADTYALRRLQQPHKTYQDKIATENMLQSAKIAAVTLHRAIRGGNDEVIRRYKQNPKLQVHLKHIYPHLHKMIEDAIQGHQSGAVNSESKYTPPITTISQSRPDDAQNIAAHEPGMSAIQQGQSDRVPDVGATQETPSSTSVDNSAIEGADVSPAPSGESSNWKEQPITVSLPDGSSKEGKISSSLDEMAMHYAKSHELADNVIQGYYSGYSHQSYNDIVGQIKHHAQNGARHARAIYDWIKQDPSRKNLLSDEQNEMIKHFVPEYKQILLGQTVSPAPASQEQAPVPVTPEPKAANEPVAAEPAETTVSAPAQQQPEQVSEQKPKKWAPSPIDIGEEGSPSHVPAWEVLGELIAAKSSYDKHTKSAQMRVGQDRDKYAELAAVAHKNMEAYKAKLRSWAESDPRHMALLSDEHKKLIYDASPTSQESAPQPSSQESAPQPSSQESAPQPESSLTTSQMEYWHPPHTGFVPTHGHDKEGHWDHSSVMMHIRESMKKHEEAYGILSNAQSTSQKEKAKEDFARWDAEVQNAASSIYKWAMEDDRNLAMLSQQDRDTINGLVSYSAGQKPLPSTDEVKHVLQPKINEQLRVDKPSSSNAPNNSRTELASDVGSPSGTSPAASAPSALSNAGQSAVPAGPPSNITRIGETYTPHPEEKPEDAPMFHPGTRVAWEDSDGDIHTGHLSYIETHRLRYRAPQAIYDWIKQDPSTNSGIKAYHTYYIQHDGGRQEPVDDSKLRLETPQDAKHFQPRDIPSGFDGALQHWKDHMREMFDHERNFDSANQRARRARSNESINKRNKEANYHLEQLKRLASQMYDWAKSDTRHEDLLNNRHIRIINSYSKKQLPKKSKSEVEEKGKERLRQNTNVEWVYNKDRNGLEVRFDRKPDSSDLEALKKLGFRWSSAGRFWYAYHSGEREKHLQETYGDRTEKAMRVKINDIVRILSKSTSGKQMSLFDDEPHSRDVRIRYSGVPDSDDWRDRQMKILSHYQGIEDVLKDRHARHLAIAEQRARSAKSPAEQQKWINIHKQIRNVHNKKMARLAGMFWEEVRPYYQIRRAMPVKDYIPSRFIIRKGIDGIPRLAYNGLSYISKAVGGVRQRLLK